MDRTGTGYASVGEGAHRAHLVGLDGDAMTGLAQLFAQRGFRVTGTLPTYSPAAQRLRELGVRLHAGHPPRPIPRSARVLVYSPETPREHPDRLSAARSGVEQASSPQILSTLLERGVGIVAFGGRKAGLVAAMVGWILTHSGLDPTIIVNTPSPQLGGCGRHGAGPHVIVEAGRGVMAPELSGAEIVLLHDESDAPRGPEEFRQGVEAGPRARYILAHAGEGPVMGPSPADTAEVERFSLAPGHAWWGADLREVRGCYRFRAFHRGRFAMEVRLQVPGRHHVLGALAAVAICRRVDLATRSIREALEEFGGVSRGFESRGSYRGVTLVDDEAPGPLSVGEALAIARQVFGRRRICVAYRPGPGCDGTWPLPSEFAAADRVWMIDEAGPSGGSTAGLLADSLAAAGAVVDRASGLDGAIRELDRHLEPGDVLVTLGAGDVGTIADAFLRRLSRDRHA